MPPVSYLRDRVVEGMCSADAEGGDGGRLLSTVLDPLDNGFERRCEVQKLRKIVKKGLTHV
eukprot:scaffold109491_cov81-Cyclotella_meneghiniana.AAC.4